VTIFSTGTNQGDVSKEGASILTPAFVSCTHLWRHPRLSVCPATDCKHLEEAFETYLVGMIEELDSCCEESLDGFIMDFFDIFNSVVCDDS
jgi:hypothetical protein